MRIFVYEHVTGSGFAGQEVPESLLCEGRAMLESFIADLSRVPGITVETMPTSRPIPASSARDGILADFDRLAGMSDGVVLIAPELNGCLASLARRVLSLGGRLLGPSPEAIERASDKLELPRLLGARKIPSIAAEPFIAKQAPSCGFPVVVKPRFGAGSTLVRLANRLADLPTPDGECENVVTPHVRGLPASLLCISGPRGILTLRAGEQILSDDGTFRYCGGRIPLPPRLEARARRLALRAVNAISGLLGFVGVDMILDSSELEEPDDRVVEINPRLTTSYVGLRALSTSNLAEHWLRVIHGEFPATPTWRSGSVEFRPDGAVELRVPAP